MTRILIAFAVLAGCYSKPEPDCGFACGPGDSCPDGYTCARDHQCHRNGASSTLVCGMPDAAIDAPVAPVVIFTSPMDGEMGVNVGATPSATFNEEVVGVSDGTMSLSSPTGAVAGNAVYSMEVAQFVTDAQLEQNTTYTAHLAAGITSTSGGALVPYQWSFTTGPDFTDPHVQMTVPGSSEAVVPVDTTIRVTFDEPVLNVTTTSFTVDAGGAVTGTIASADMRTFTFTPDAALPAASTVTVTLDGTITDRYHNPLTPYTFAFTTQ
jgi:hypothetical protein